MCSLHIELIGADAKPAKPANSANPNSVSVCSRGGENCINLRLTPATLLSYDHELYTRLSLSDCFLFTDNHGTSPLVVKSRLRYESFRENEKNSCITVSSLTKFTLLRSGYLPVNVRDFRDKGSQQHGSPNRKPGQPFKG